MEKYRNVQEQTAYRMLTSLLQFSPGYGWEHEIEKCASKFLLPCLYSRVFLSLASSLLSSLFQITYGWSSNEIGQRHDILAFTRDFESRLINAVMPWNYLIDVFPLLEYIPRLMNPWKIRGAKYQNESTKVLVGLVDEVRAKIVSPSRSQPLTPVLDR